MFCSWTINYVQEIKSIIISQHYIVIGDEWDDTNYYWIMVDFFNVVWHLILHISVLLDLEILTLKNVKICRTKC